MTPLQRAMVRAMFDPTFDPATGDGLTDVERGWLARVDPRAWRTDPERTRRLLGAWLEELPVSGALAIRARGVDALLGAFRWEGFRVDVATAPRFGEWLVGWGGAVGAVARLEAAAARVRRWRDPGGPMRRGRVEPVTTREGALALVSRPPRSLAEVLAGMEGSVGEGDEHVLVEADRMGEAPAELCALLAGEPAPRAVWVARARELGAEDDADEVIDGLVADGLLLA